MATKQQLIRRARKLGARVEISNGDSRCIEIEAPAGKLWDDFGMPVKFLLLEPEGWERMADVYDELISRMNGGLVDDVSHSCA